MALNRQHPSAKAADPASVTVKQNAGQNIPSIAGYGSAPTKKVEFMDSKSTDGSSR